MKTDSSTSEDSAQAVDHKINTATKRKSIGKKTRFEVFKRDSFTCLYCGDSAPSVVLNVDHLKPVSKGGSNHITNLVTACFSCNSGKSNIELADDAVLTKQKAQLDELQERRNQLEMMMEWHEAIADEKNDRSQMAIDYFNKKLVESCSSNLSETGQKKVSNVAKKYTFEDVLKAIDIGFEQYIDSDKFSDIDEALSHCLKKIGGICQNLHKDEYEIRKYYVKAIIERRHYEMHYSESDEFFEIFGSAKAAGVPLSEIECSVKRSRNIADALDGIERLTQARISQATE